MGGHRARRTIQQRGFSQARSRRRGPDRSALALAAKSVHHARETSRERMTAKIALEEHFAIEATHADSQVFGAHVWDRLGPRLTDFQDQRLRLMDASDVEIMILSLNAPAVQAIS